MMRFIISIYFVVIASTLSAKEFNILDYGAVADGKTLNTTFIQATIDAAYKIGGGTVHIPKGKFLTGSIQLKSNVILNLSKDAELIGSINPDDYFQLKRWKALIIADSETNISIIGPGKIDGQGRALALAIDALFYEGKMDSSDYHFAHNRPREYMRPQLIEFVNCKNVTIKNITLLNGASWLQTYERCTNVSIENITVRSDAFWNNDGLDIVDCKNVRITNCDINSADDGICLKSASPEFICDSIYISNCKIRSSASAIKFGTVSHGGFRNVHIENIQVYDTYRSALAIECVDGGVLENIFVNHINAINTGNAIFIKLGDRTKRGDGSVLRNIEIKNMIVEIASHRPDSEYEIIAPDVSFPHNIFPSSITGMPGNKVENILLENIEIKYPGKGNNALANLPISRLNDVPENGSSYPEYTMFGELPAWAFYIRHVQGIQIRNVKVSIENADYRPAFVFDDVQNLLIENLKITGDEKQQQIILHHTENEKIENEKQVFRLK